MLIDDLNLGEVRKKLEKALNETGLGIWFDVKDIFYNENGIKFAVHGKSLSVDSKGHPYRRRYRTRSPASIIMEEATVEARNRFK